MLSLSTFLRDAEEYRELFEKLSAGVSPIVVSGLSHIHKAHLAAAIRRITTRPVYCVFSDDFAARNAARDIAALAEEEAHIFIAREFTFYNVESASHDWEHERISTLHAMASGRAGLVCTSAAALMQRTMPPGQLLEQAVILKSGGEYSMQALCERLVAFGYKRAELVEAQGQFAQRGGILDFFSPSMKNPVRLEFWGDEIDSMGEFDPEGQRRIANLTQVMLLPAQETLLSGAARERLITQLSAYRAGDELQKTLDQDLERLREGMLFPALDRYLPLIYDDFFCGADYLPKNAIVLIDDYYKTSDAAQRFCAQHDDDMKTLLTNGTLAPECCEFLEDFDAVWRTLSRHATVLLDTFLRASYPTPPKALFSVLAKQLPSYGGNLEVACEDVSGYAEQKYRIIVLCGSADHARLLKDALARHGLAAGLDLALERLPEPGQIVLAAGSLSAGFEYPNERLALFTEGQLVVTARRSRHGVKRANRKKIASYQDLSVGCLVVHELHGIGRFAGIAKIPVDHVEKDYIKIIYAGTDALYVPVTQLDMVSKYIGGGEDAPIKLSKLGGADWERAKSRAKGAAKELAQQLVALYAERERTPGHAFPPDCSWQREFEDSFEFQETDDQLRCIHEIKEDMQRPRPMDRLLCGDVGFGKTEVALRAIMKCVLGGKQAAILVPTTVLAQQHFVTTRRRFANYPVKIAQLSRFCSPAQNRETLRALRAGRIDLVIGTHKLLQKGVAFHDLGLLIVDEEQRFGVAHKERLKELSKNIDVLTLTATPIPRTLNMALSGIRDMSVIEEAPRNRHPVQTYVFEHDWNVIADAIRRELARGGQVYYLHNRVDSIAAAAARITRLIPDISVAVAHGQMEEGELSEVMERMAEGEIQVLVCTTIIETGIDIPNVNTLIIEDADRLGLSQLHQIRGRVGRSPRHAYAYLTYRRGKILTDVAEKRLSAIREYAEFGSGFKIAMRDLEIRGAGNVLGAQQSGHMMSVGYDMYLKLLEEAVSEEQGQPRTSSTECTADFTVSANIPEKYIASPEQRMDIYREIATIADEDDRADLIDELCDRFGEPPRETLLLMDIALLRHHAARAGICDISQKGNTLKITMAAPEFSYISKLCANPAYRGKILLNAGAEPYLTLRLAEKQDALEAAEAFIRDYAAAQEEQT